MRFIAQVYVILILVWCCSVHSRDSEQPVDWVASKLLTGEDILDYELALNKFIEFKDPRVLSTLMKLADSTDPIPQAESAGVLWHYDTPEVRDRLQVLLSSPKPEVRIEAAKSLCLLNHSAAFSTLILELKNKSANVRGRTIRALAALKTARAKKILEDLRAIQAPIDRIWVAYALYVDQINPRQELQVLEKTLLSMPDGAWLPGKPDPSDFDLEQAAKLGKVFIPLRLAAAKALSRIGDSNALQVLARGTGVLALSDNPQGPGTLLLRHGENAVQSLILGLKDPKVLIRLGCAHTVRRLHLREPQNAEELESVLGKNVLDGSRLVRIESMRALAALGFKAQSTKIIAALKHDDPQTRGAAAQALGTLKDPESLHVLIQQLKTEKNRTVREKLYEAIAQLHSPESVEPMFNHLKLLYQESRQNQRITEELPLCIDALASGGDAAASKALGLLPKLHDDRLNLMIEVLAHSGSEQAIDFFIQKLRETPPEPDGPEVRFFESLDAKFAPRLEYLIEHETAMWIRVILARTLFKMGKVEYARGLLWGLRNEDGYIRKLAAALSAHVNVPGSTPELIQLLENKPETALFASRALLSIDSPEAIGGFLNHLESESLRQRRLVPLNTFWEGQRTATHPFAKEVDNERVWVLFADNRLGRKMDLFITWSDDGKSWESPLFTGLTSFADPEGNVPPPTFSLQVHEREITIALTRTFAQSPNPRSPRFTTLQRVHNFKLQDLFKDSDSDGLRDLEEQVLFTNPMREDTDGDGSPDGKDKNPLAKPANTNRPDDILKVLAFSYAFLVKECCTSETRLLVVAETPGQRPIPELPTFPWLVLHLNPVQIDTLWKSTGGGFPQVIFENTEFSKNGSKAIQAMKIKKGIDDEKLIKIEFKKISSQWVVNRILD